MATIKSNYRSEAGFACKRRETSLFNFMESVIGSLKTQGRLRTGETYQSTLNSFRNFREGQDIKIVHIDPELMECYETWLKQRGVVKNTISFYARILRAVYNRAVEKGITGNRHPFRHVYTGIDKTVKRALPISIIKKINSLELDAEPALDYARDIFMMSFMLRGISLVDMAFLRKCDLQKGVLRYRRRKTHQQLSVKWTREMQAILDKYPENETPYLLPIIRRQGPNERAAYMNEGCRINRSLKKLAAKVGVTVPLTLYAARHSWASAAYAKGIPVRVISEGMGHDSETTTLIYLSSLDTSAVDKANDLLLKALSI